MVIYIVFAGLLFMEKPTPTKPEFSLAAILLLPAVIATFFVVSFEIPTLQRIVSLTDTDFSCVGGLMTAGGVGPIHWLTSMRTMNRREIKQVQLLRPGDPDNRFSFGLLIVTPKYGRPQICAMPTTISQEMVANHFHAMQIDVQLTDWQSPLPSAQ